MFNVSYKEGIITTEPKGGSYRRKYMLHVWYDHRGIVHFGVLNHNQRLDADFIS